MRHGMLLIVGTQTLGWALAPWGGGNLVKQWPGPWPWPTGVQPMAKIHSRQPERSANNTAKLAPESRGLNGPAEGALWCATGVTFWQCILTHPKARPLRPQHPEQPGVPEACPQPGVYASRKPSRTHQPFGGEPLYKTMNCDERPKTDPHPRCLLQRAQRLHCGCIGTGARSGCHEELRMWTQVVGKMLRSDDCFIFRSMHGQRGVGVTPPSKASLRFLQKCFPLPSMCAHGPSRSSGATVGSIKRPASPGVPGVVYHASIAVGTQNHPANAVGLVEHRTRVCDG